MPPTSGTVRLFKEIEHGTQTWRHCASSRDGALALMALTGAERMARLRERQRAGEKPVRFRRPKDRRSRPQLWQEAVSTLLVCLDAYQDWRNNLPVQSRSVMVQTHP